jgi:hypothetical protein
LTGRGNVIRIHFSADRNIAASPERVERTIPTTRKVIGNART